MVLAQLRARGGQEPAPDPAAREDAVSVGQDMARPTLTATGGWARRIRLVRVCCGKRLGPHEHQRAALSAHSSARRGESCRTSGGRARKLTCVWFSTALWCAGQGGTVGADFRAPGRIPSALQGTRPQTHVCLVFHRPLVRTPGQHCRRRRPRTGADPVGPPENAPANSRVFGSPPPFRAHANPAALPQQTRTRRIRRAQPPVAVSVGRAMPWPTLTASSRAAGSGTGSWPPRARS